MVVLYDKFSQFHVYMCWLLIELESPDVPGLGRLARKCSWELNYFTLSIQIKSNSNILYDENDILLTWSVNAGQTLTRFE